MSSTRLRIGRILFTNVWPVYYHFPEERFADQIELVTKVPSSLNAGMESGDIILGPISSFAYGEHDDRYILFPDLSVSCKGRVNSIFLFHKKPLAEIAHGRIMLPNTSATSVNLLKIIMSRFLGGDPQYRYDEPHLSRMRPDEDAALLIGDDAIKAGWTNDQYQITDLGELWHHYTGEWMTFAVWALSRKAAEEHPQLVSQLYHAFQESKRLGLSESEPILRHAVATIGGTELYWRSYFNGLSHDFGPEQWKGLQLYYDYAFELGLLDRPVRIEIWQDNPSCR